MIYRYYQELDRKSRYSAHFFNRSFGRLARSRFRAPLNALALVVLLLPVSDLLLESHPPW